MRLQPGRLFRPSPGSFSPFPSSQLQDPAESTGPGPRTARRKVPPATLTQQKRQPPQVGSVPPGRDRAIPGQMKFAPAVSTLRLVPRTPAAPPYEHSRRSGKELVEVQRRQPLITEAEQAAPSSWGLMGICHTWRRREAQRRALRHSSWACCPHLRASRRGRFLYLAGSRGSSDSKHRRYSRHIEIVGLGYQNCSQNASSGEPKYISF